MIAPMLAATVGNLTGVTGVVLAIVVGLSAAAGVKR